MVLEIRRYSIVPGRRDEFVEWFETEVAPAMTAAGIQIIGSFVSQDDPDAFVYIRGFADDDERVRRTDEFHSGEQWVGRMRDRALEMETSYSVEVVRSTPASAI